MKGELKTEEMMSDIRLKGLQKFTSNLKMLMEILKQQDSLSFDQAS